MTTEDKELLTYLVGGIIGFFVLAHILINAMPGPKNEKPIKQKPSVKRDRIKCEYCNEYGKMFACPECGHQAFITNKFLPDGDSYECLECTYCENEDETNASFISCPHCNGRAYF